MVAKKTIPNLIQSYELGIQERQIVTMVRSARVLSVKVINNRIMLFALINNKDMTQERMFTVVSTGRAVKYFEQENYRFIDTVTLENVEPTVGYPFHLLTLHIFEEE
jgi:adenine-specific DNA methylase